MSYIIYLNLFCHEGHNLGALIENRFLLLFRKKKKLVLVMAPVMNQRPPQTLCRNKWETNNYLLDTIFFYVNCQIDLDIKKCLGRCSPKMLKVVISGMWGCRDFMFPFLYSLYCLNFFFNKSTQNLKLLQKMKWAKDY